MPLYCSIPSCDKSHDAKGWCSAHYSRWRRSGDPLRPSTARRFWTKVDFTGPVPEYRPELGPCWLWEGAKNTQTWDAYGVAWIGGKLLVAHRYAYEFCVGPIPGGLQIDHLCRVRLCVNPWHNEPVTNRENVLRGRQYARIHYREAALQ